MFRDYQYNLLKDTFRMTRKVYENEGYVFKDASYVISYNFNSGSQIASVKKLEGSKPTILSAETKGFEPSWL